MDDLSSEAWKSEGSEMRYLKYSLKKTPQIRENFPQMREKKTFPDKQKLRESEQLNKNY